MPMVFGKINLSSLIFITVSQNDGGNYNNDIDVDGHTVSAVSEVNLDLDVPAWYYCFLLDSEYYSDIMGSGINNAENPIILWLWSVKENTYHDLGRGLTPPSR